VTGEVVYYFAFDVASEIRLESGRALLVERGLLAGPEATPAWPRGLALPAPLAMTARGAAERVGGQPLTVEVRLFEFGAVSVVMRVRFSANDVTEVGPLLNATLDGGGTPEALARRLCADACDAVRQALVKPSGVGPPELYTVVRIGDLGGPADTEAWLAEHRAPVAGLLAGLPAGRISAGQVEEVFRQQRSLTRFDAVVLAWDAALVIDLAGPAADVLFAIEVANLQLEEFRQMDRSLDRFLDNAYDDLERPGFSLLGSSAVLRKLRRFRVDLAKLADEVSNSTKVFGDWHLARVYQAARERFHLDRWRDSVERRLQDLDQLYNLVRSELWDRRMFVLELVIAVLIVLELIAGLGLTR
jgi:hypothetical protein